MYEHAWEHADVLLGVPGSRVYAFFQVKAAVGIPDVVLATFDDAEVERRVHLELAPIVDAADVLALSYLARLSRQASTAEIASRVGLTAGYLSSTVLPRLVNGGHAQKRRRGTWVATHEFNSTVRKLVTVEAKLTAWQQALCQAHRHAAGADRAWVLLDNEATGPAIRHLPRFAQTRVGVAGLQSSGALSVHQDAPLRKAHPIARRILAERVMRLFTAGESSWEWSSLFGAHARRPRAIQAN